MTQTDKTTPTLERIVEAVMNVLKDSSIDDMSKAVFETNIHSDIATVLDEKVTDEMIEKEAMKPENAGSNYVKNHMPGAYQNSKIGFMKGAKWMRDRCARPEWISVEDRLPEPNEEVLVCNENGVFCMTHTYSPIRFWTAYGESAGRTGITHWQPLPTLPHEKI